MILSVVLALGLAAAPSPSPGPDPRAPDEATANEATTELLRRADAAFAEGRLLDAWDAIDEAEAIRPEPFYDYMRGLIRQAQGRCDLAVEHWARFLESQPSESDAADVRVLIEECGGLPQPAAPATTAEAPAVPAVTPLDADHHPARTTPGSPDSASPETTESRPWHRDPLGGVLLGVGSVCLAGAGASALASNRLHARATDGDSLMTHDTRLQRARTLGVVAIGAGVVGLSLVVGATIRYARMARRARGLSRIGPGPTLRF